LIEIMSMQQAGGANRSGQEELARS
jgi:hypothetical protein